MGNSLMWVAGDATWDHGGRGEVLACAATRATSGFLATQGSVATKGQMNVPGLGFHLGDVNAESCAEMAQPTTEIKGELASRV